MLTENQKKALDYNRHLCVTANAGAGKTTVLVQRFVEILLNTDARVDQLVAITFTDKAASELKKKIAERIEERIPTAPSSKELIRLEQIRDQLASSNIGTIHSFCARLLREYPVEADVDAGFTVIEGVDQQLLEQEVMRSTFESILGNSTNLTEQEEILDIIRMLGQKTVQEYLTIFLRKREQIDRQFQSDGIYSTDVSPEEILRRWKSHIGDSLAIQLNDPRWKEALRRICNVAEGKKTGDVASLLKTWDENLPLDKKISLYRQLFELVLTTKGLIRKNFIGTHVDPQTYTPEESILAEHYASIVSLLDTFGAGEILEADRILLQVTQALFKVYGSVLETYDNKKLENGQLDFEDLQLKTCKLLQQEEVRTRVAQKYKFIMVDEFQDTNRLQYEIVRLLVSDFQTGNLFIVGDPKQSIYGFRNAEVEVFEMVKRGILESSKHSFPYRSESRDLESTPEERKGLITLPESYRLLVNIVAFVNRVFSHTMGNSPIQYDELVKGRANEAHGSIELMLVPDEAGENDDGDAPKKSVRNECVMIARRIVEFVRTRYPIYDKKSEQPHPFQYKDAAILLRSRTHLREIEKALVDHNVPYLLSGGIGFYQTQEVFDFLNYFKFLLNPEDDVSLVGVLRSPFFAVSDAELFEISLMENNDSFWLKIRKYVRLTKASQLSIHAVNVLNEDLAYAKRLPVPFLVQRIFRNTGWRGTIAGLTSGGQNAANIQKLLTIAREFAGRGFTTLFDFVERLKTLVAREEREGQASIEAAGNCVQVMTIHAAKGLEFPVVFIPFVHQKFRYDKPPYINSDLGVGFKVRKTDNFDEELSPALYNHLRQESKRKTEAEEKRILYVACTRARDVLLISGKLNPNSNHHSYLRWIVDSLKLDMSALSPGTLVLEKSRVKILERNNTHIHQKETDYAVEIEVSFWNDETMQRSKPADEVGKFLAKTILIEPVKSQTSGEFFSATQIKTFLECPTKYFLKYHLGLPENNALHFDYDENEDPNDRIMGEVEGSLTHTALQHLEKEDNEDRIRERVGNLVDSVVLGNEGRRNAAIELITKNILNFNSSRFGKEVLSAGETRTEYTLSTAFGEDFLTGTMDRLYKDNNGLWCVLDYKTDRLTEKDLLLKAEQHKHQLSFYALLVHKMFQQKTVRATLHFLNYADSPVHYDFSEEEIKSFETIVKDSIIKIKTGEFNRAQAVCKNCTYQLNGECLLASNGDKMRLFSRSE